MRFVPTGMKVREMENGAESRTIEGCAIVFNAETVLWDGKYERVREVIAPSCITEEFLREQDIKLNLLHDRQDTIARNNKGTGNLQLDLREDGLYFSAELPECDICDRALAMVRTGVYSGCSFEFWPKDYTEVNTTMEDGREDVLITHTSFARVDALTVAMDPAYEQTSVGLREQMEKREKEKEQPLSPTLSPTGAREVSTLTDEGDPDYEAKRREEEAEREKFTRETTSSAMQKELELMELEMNM